NAAHLGEVKVSEALVLARLKKDGRLNLLDLITVAQPTTNKPSAAPAPVADAQPLAVTVDAFTIEQTSVTFEDLTLNTPFKSELKPIEVTVKDFTTKTNSNAQYSFRVTSEVAEVFSGAGTFSVNP